MPNKKDSCKESFLLKRHRAIFPGLEDPSIVTAERLNCCVRHGNRCFPLAMGTDYVPRLVAQSYESRASTSAAPIFFETTTSLSAVILLSLISAPMAPDVDVHYKLDG